MRITQKRFFFVFLVAMLIVFLKFNTLSAQGTVNGNDTKRTDIVAEQDDDVNLNDSFEDDMKDETIPNTIGKKLKKYRKTKKKLTPEQKKQKLIDREIKRFEKAKKSIHSREKKAKAILKKAEKDLKKELIRHDKRIEEIENMEFDK